MKKIFFHVGADKSGSSAIQNFLSLNRLAFLKFGFVVPSEDLGIPSDTQICAGHCTGFFSKISAVDYPFIKKKIDLIFSSFDCKKNIIISAENLFYNNFIPLFEYLVRFYHIEIVFYIRRQDDYLESSWRQWGFREGLKFRPWLLLATRERGHWNRFINRILLIVDKFNVNVRLYERSNMFNNNICYDFLDSLNISNFKDFLFDESDVNQSLSANFVSLLAGNNRIYIDPHDNSLLDSLGSSINAQFKSSQLDFSERKVLLDIYAHENSMISKLFFNRSKLFDEPNESDYPSANIISTDQQLQILTSIILNHIKSAH